MEAGQVLTTHVVLVFSELGKKKIHGKIMCGIRRRVMVVVVMKMK